MKNIKKQHLAIYLPSLCGGGAERVMVTLANSFASRGYRVDLVLVRSEGPYLAEVAQGVHVINLNKDRVLFSLISLIRYLRRERPDAMLSALNHANLVAILARKFAQIPVRLVVSERNSLLSLHSGMRGRLVESLMRYFYPMADQVIAVSRDGATELVTRLELPEHKVSAIANPVPVDEIKALSALVPDHPWLAPNGPSVVLAVGRLEIQKGYHTLLRAFATLRQSHDLRLIILGEGSQRSYLESLIKELGLDKYVELPGFLPNPFAWMGACDLYVMSSLYEGFPNSLVQAMACGARIVSTNCPTGPAEILENGLLGSLVPVGDVEALAQAMLAALTNPAPPDGSRKVRDYSVKNVVDEYLKAMLLVQN